MDARQLQEYVKENPQEAQNIEKWIRTRTQQSEAGRTQVSKKSLLRNKRLF